MGSPVTVPADLLPGLVRKGAACAVPSLAKHGLTVAYVDGDGGVGAWMPTSSGGLPASPRLVYATLAEVEIDLTEPTGWDAAVDALARHFWPDMAPTDRAEFCVADGCWTLFAPARLQRRKPRPPGFSSWHGWTDAYIEWTTDPHEALRRVLHHMAGRPPVA